MPPSASWNLPIRLSTAPVNEPFSWPKRMLSTRFSGMAPQLTVMNGLRLALALALDGARDQLLADAAFALDQDRNVGGRGTVPERYDALHGLAADDEVTEGECALGLLLDTRDFALQRLDLERAVDRRPRAVGRGRLDDEVGRTGAHRTDGGVDGAVSRLHDDGRSARLRREAPQDLHAIHAGHDMVEQNQRDGGAIRPLQDLQGLFAALGGPGLEAETPDGFFEDATLRGIVIDDQDELGHWWGLDSTQLITVTSGATNFTSGQSRTNLLGSRRVPHMGKRIVSFRPVLKLYCQMLSRSHSWIRARSAPAELIGDPWSWAAYAKLGLRSSGAEHDREKLACVAAASGTCRTGRSPSTRSWADASLEPHRPLSESQIRGRTGRSTEGCRIASAIKGRYQGKLALLADDGAKLAQRLQTTKA